MSKLYTRVPVKRFPKSTFPQSRAVAGSMSAQRLYCTNAKEVLPADDWRASSEAFVRVQPLVAPVLAKLSVHQEAFFVPCWQLNDHFEDFITRGERGTYNEKMPYIHVSTLYNAISWLLDWEDDRLALFGFTDEDKVLDVYTFIVDKVVRIIELSDWFRSVPFVQPEFLRKPSVMEDNEEDLTVTQWFSKEYTWGDIFYDALSAFQSLNQQLDNSELRINLLPYFAALKVYCEFYRDENLVEDWWDAENNWKDISFKWTGDVSQEAIFTPADLDEHDWKLFFALFCVKNRAWSKDRFTSALPFVQKGPDVILPLSGTAPVDFISESAINSSLHDVHAAGSPSQSRNVQLSWYAGEGLGDKKISAQTNFNEAQLATTIRDFRTANKLEEFYEADGIGGSRYPENTLVQWGERSPDARLPRAQFLGSFSQPVSIAEVLQTSSTDSTSPQGNLAGKATSYGRGFLFAKHFSMHGFLLFFTSVKTGAIYEQGINPMFSRYDWTEYAWPRFAHLGEEPIYTKELAVNSDVAEDTVFGYAPRYSDYKSDQGSIHGQLKSTLNYWTMSRRFANTPALNEEFIYGDPRRDSFAVVNPFAEQFIVEVDYKIKSRRKLPFFGVPSL